MTANGNQSPIKNELYAVVSLMFGVLLATLPSCGNEAAEKSDRVGDSILNESRNEKVEKISARPPDAGEGAAAKHERGSAGREDAGVQKARTNRVAIAKQRVGIAKRRVDRNIAESAGVLGALHDDSDLNGAFDTLGMSPDIRELIDAKGVPIGANNLGHRGSGCGGGGKADGISGLGTKGLSWDASRNNVGDGRVGTIGKASGDPTILGPLQRPLIDRVVRRHMNQIRSCYQRELTRNRALGGRLVIKFVIANNGSVSSASVRSTTMNSEATEQCVVGRFKRMQFPKPEGGGIVVVSYPFLFSPR